MSDQKPLPESAPPPSAAARAKAYSGVVVPGGKRAINYIGRAVGSEISRARGALPSLDHMRRAARGELMPELLDDVDYSVAGIDPAHREAWLKNATGAWWLYLMIAVCGAISLTFAVASTLSALSINAAVFNAAFCGLGGLVLGLLMLARVARDIWLLSELYRVPLKDVLRSPELLIPIRARGFTSSTMKIMPLLIAISMALVSIPALVIAIRMANIGFFPMAALVGLVAFGLYRLRGWVQSIDARNSEMMRAAAEGSPDA